MNSPLQGGQMRRSRRGRVAPPRRARVATRLLVLVFLSLTATAAWLVVGETKTADAPNGHAPVLGDLGTSTHPPARPSGAAPPPGISLFGAKPIRIHFKQPPRAGLVFDLDTGQVLWAD